MPNHSGAVIESQADWLTVSAHGETKARLLADLAVRLQGEEEARGAKPRKWRSMGYEGLSVGRVQYGQRDIRATEMRLSGDAAAEHLEIALALSDNVTRLDLAATWRADEPLPLLGARTYVKALNHTRGHAKAALPWSVRDAKGGFTLYVGQRASEYYFRLYNKEAQERSQMGRDYDGRYDRCWRYELEMKASVALAVSRKLLAAEDRPSFVQGYVHSYAERHGLEPPFEDAGGQTLLPGFRRKSDEETKLLHLQKNVRPTVDWLTSRGRGEDARASLGLS